MAGGYGWVEDRDVRHLLVREIVLVIMDELATVPPARGDVGDRERGGFLKQIPPQGFQVRFVVSSLVPQVMESFNSCFPRSDKLRVQQNAVSFDAIHVGESHEIPVPFPGGIMGERHYGNWRPDPTGLFRFLSVLVEIDSVEAVFVEKESRELWLWLGFALFTGIGGRAIGWLRSGGGSVAVSVFRRLQWAWRGVWQTRGFVRNILM
jgi:hypothetical protein